MYVLTIDIGGTTCSTALTGDDGVGAFTTWPTEGSVGNLGRAVEHYSAHLAGGGQPAAAVGVCFGGPVDHRTSTVLRSVHVPGWEGFDFATWAGRELGLPLAVDNDANVGALAEHKHGGHGVDDLVYVTISTGVGAGVVTSGHLLRGRSNEAGELGHVRVADDARVCNCGRTGCLERLCSGYWIEHDYGKPARELLADTSFLTSYSGLVARGLATATLLYNPSVIVLGGGVARAGQPLIEAVAATLESELASWSHMAPVITASAFDNHGVHLGAMELARELF